jgi:DNA repair protein RadA/Sms
MERGARQCDPHDIYSSHASFKAGDGMTGREDGAARSRNAFQCKSCGHKESKWLGRCPSCGMWNSFTEIAEKTGHPKAKEGGKHSVPLSSIENRGGMRMESGISELDRVLGGGIMRGSSVLVGGEPGIGKSTLMLQAAARLPSAGRVVYVSGEESPGQLRMRAERIGAVSDRIEVLAETELTAVMQALELARPVLIVVDSIQTLYSREVNALPGTVNQIKTCTQELVDWAKSREAAIFLVAHVTKEGVIAGPKLVEHLVDTVLSFEQASAEIRTLQAMKNRFGSVEEIGFFAMTDAGLSEIQDSSSLFLVHRQGEQPAGVAVAPVFEGSRVLLVEIQSLVVPAKSGISRVYSDRIDAGRVARVAAVLEKHLGARLSDLDIYVNVAGGIRISEVGVELPLALALYSARVGAPLPAGTAVTGEVSLAGEVRPVGGMEKRLKAAREMGFSTLIGPPPRAESPEKIGITEVDEIRTAVRVAFGEKQAGT